ncbi:hypothetical protein DEJ55_07565 [Bacillus pumilus]|nr:hypothetical protein DEJ55_07565 [Bacillus pumilus]
MKYGKVTDRLAGARRYFLLRTGLVYTRVEICEYIPDSVEHAAMTPNVEDETAETVEYVHLRLPDGSTIQQRPYPIYYWFKIFFDRTGKKEAQYNHYDSPINFNQSLEQANLYTLKGFNLI